MPGIPPIIIGSIYPSIGIPIIGSMPIGPIPGIPIIIGSMPITPLESIIIPLPIGSIIPDPIIPSGPNSGPVYSIG